MLTVCQAHNQGGVHGVRFNPLTGPKGQHNQFKESSRLNWSLKLSNDV